MSTTRAISASRQRTGSRSPRRAWVVRFTATRSSTSPESNSPSNGSLIQVRRPPGIAGTSHKTQDRTRKPPRLPRSEEHTSELQSRSDLVCRLLLEKKKKKKKQKQHIDNHIHKLTLQHDKPKTNTGRNT